MSETATKPTDPTNSDLTFEVGEPGHDYCQMCQAPRSQGGFMHRNWPTTTFAVKMTVRTTGEVRYLSDLCTDCLIEAAENKVTVLDESSGKPWTVTGLTNRNGELLQSGDSVLQRGKINQQWEKIKNQ